MVFDYNHPIGIIKNIYYVIFPKSFFFFAWKINHLSQLLYRNDDPL